MNLFANRPNVLVAKQTISFVSCGFTVDNMNIVYQIGSQTKSWVPGRTINGITGFESDKGYYVVPKVDFDLSTVLAFPLPNEYTTLDWTGKIVVFIGDSITAADNWNTQLCTTKGATSVNMGVGGRVLQPGNTCGRDTWDNANIPTKATDHIYLFMALGVNDIGINNGMPQIFSASSYKTQLDAFITAAIAKGWTADRVVLVTPYYYYNYGSYVGSCGVVTASTITIHEAYVQAAKDVAQLRGTVLADIYAAMTAQPTPNDLISGDGIHPNSTGFDFIATFMEGLSYRPQGWI